jgi:hypothetical protein
MAAQTIFRIQLVFGYLVWALVVAVYVVPWLRSLGRAKALRAVAALHAFRFFGLVFLLPGFIGANLPVGFAAPAAYGDFATALLAILAFACFRVPALFWGFVVAFNIVGAADLIMDTANAIQFNVPAVAGQLGAAYAIPILFVPLLMVTHIVAFYLLFSRTTENVTSAVARPSPQA